ncbi:MAG: head GIN domain-containing protein [Saprospiraceae bacterium]|nr:DUF2807 domain-containing protein [Lewinella sp.]
MKNLAVIFGIMLLFSFNTQAQNWWKNGISGEGPVVKRTLDLDDFSAIRLTNNAKVYIRQGSPQSVEVEAQENIIDNLKREVSDDAWTIGFDRSVRRYDGMKVYITLPSLRGLRVSGSGSITSESRFTGVEDMDVSISGSGDIRLEVESASIDSHISGSGNIKLRGTTGRHEVHISGSGNVEAYELNSESCKVQISGSGDCDVDVREDLEVRISGSGDVNYKGRPRISSRISGSGDINGRSGS